MFELQEFPKAFDYYNRAIERDPENPWVWHSIGHAFYAIDDLENAIECFDFALKHDPVCLEAWIGKGDSYLEQWNLEKAELCFEKATELDPLNIEALIGLGRTLHFLKKHHHALECFNDALKIDPQNAFSWQSRGSIFVELNRIDEAIECLNNAIKWNPEDARNWYERGVADVYLGKTGIRYFKKAVKLYKQYLEIIPEDHEVLSNLSLIYGDYLGDHKKALSVSEKIMAIQPDNITLLGMVEDLLALERYEDARSAANDVIEKSDDIGLQLISRFYILMSYGVEGSPEFNKQVKNFVKHYKKLTRNFMLKEGAWVFRGIKRIIQRAGIDVVTEFVLLTMLDLITGNVVEKEMSFFEHDEA